MILNHVRFPLIKNKKYHQAKLFSLKPLPSWYPGNAAGYDSRQNAIFKLQLSYALMRRSAGFMPLKISLKMMVSHGSANVKSNQKLI